MDPLSALLRPTESPAEATEEPPKEPKITVLGSLNIDFSCYVLHHPQPGETLTANHVTVSPGGKGANQAVACGKLSRRPGALHGMANIAMIGAVGLDTYGAQLLTSLNSFGVDTSAVIVPRDQGVRTGIAMIIVDEPTGQNRIILSPEANHTLTPSMFIRPDTWLPAPKPDLVIMQLEIPLDTVLHALRAASAAAVPVLLNPAPAQPLPDDIYEGLAHLVANETEAAILSGLPVSTLDDLPGLQRVAKLFLDKGVAHVVITLGARGVFYATNQGQSELVPAGETTVVDTTAAGDTFVGSYALDAVGAVDRNAPGADPNVFRKPFVIADAVRAANRAAAITVSRKGAQVSIPWMSELSERSQQSQQS